MKQENKLLVVWFVGAIIALSGLMMLEPNTGLGVIVLLAGRDIAKDMNRELAKLKKDEKK